MPSQGQHLAQAAHNEGLFDLLERSSPVFVDWQITALFYAALHYVEAYLATVGTTGIHLESHQQRSRYVARDSFLEDRFVDYQELKNRSEDARYRLIRFDRLFANRLREAQLMRIAEAVRRRLSV